MVYSDHSMDHVSTLFAIRHRPTGNFLPQLSKQKKGGFTKTIPTDAKTLPPRLFTKKQHARCALTWWLRGRCYEGTYTDGGESWYDPPYTVSSGVGKIKKMQNRKEEDMEIIKIHLITPSE